MLEHAPHDKHSVRHRRPALMELGRRELTVLTVLMVLTVLTGLTVLRVPWVEALISALERIAAVAAGTLHIFVAADGDVSVRISWTNRTVLVWTERLRCAVAPVDIVWRWNFGCLSF